VPLFSSSEWGHWKGGLGGGPSGVSTPAKIIYKHPARMVLFADCADSFVLSRPIVGSDGSCDLVSWFFS